MQIIKAVDADQSANSGLAAGDLVLMRRRLQLPHHSSRVEEATNGMFPRRINSQLAVFGVLRCPYLLRHTS